MCGYILFKGCYYFFHWVPGMATIQGVASIWINTIRIVDLGQIYYQPPKFKVHMLRNAIWDVTQTWSWSNMQLHCAILAANYLMNMLIALTACTDRIWMPKSGTYFFPCSIAWHCVKVHRFLPLNEALLSDLIYCFSYWLQNFNTRQLLQMNLWKISLSLTCVLSCICTMTSSKIKGTACSIY